ncbi:hypothetical protein K4F52_004498 [Lecanicillium sp. MT-2017a]|nr:hypothetical protein K4F52_004498 [Lecanicillium sp. MT-2017a]
MGMTKFTIIKQANIGSKPADESQCEDEGIIPVGGIVSLYDDDDENDDDDAAEEDDCAYGFQSPYTCRDVRYAQSVWERSSGKATLDAYGLYCGGNRRSLFYLAHRVWVCNNHKAVDCADSATLTFFMTAVRLATGWMFKEKQVD